MQAWLTKDDEMNNAKTYSQFLAGLSPDERRKYYERPTPLDKRIPTGVTEWDASIGRHVVIR